MPPFIRHLCLPEALMTKSAFPLATPPKPARHAVTDTHHGVTRTDEYAWMRADNWQEVFKDPAVLDPAIRPISRPRMPTRPN